MSGATFEATGADVVADPCYTSYQEPKWNPVWIAIIILAIAAAIGLGLSYWLKADQIFAGICGASISLAIVAVAYFFRKTSTDFEVVRRRQIKIVRSSAFTSKVWYGRLDHQNEIFINYERGEVEDKGVGALGNYFLVLSLPIGEVIIAESSDYGELDEMSERICRSLELDQKSQPKAASGAGGRKGKSFGRRS